MNKKELFVLAVVIIISITLGGLGTAIAETSARPDRQGALESIGENYLSGLAATQNKHYIPEMIGANISLSRGFQEEILPGLFSFQTPSSIEPVDETFPIAESSDWEDSPAIAYGGDYFLVVYRKAGRIWGSFYDNHGVLTSIWFPESPETNFNTPRVAYSHDTDQFLVIYHDANADRICIVTLSYPDPPDARLCSSMADNIQNPDITCVNPGDTCLVVFESDQGIMGFYVTLDGFGVQAGGLQNFSDRPGERPFITYGTGDVAMITFTWTDPDSGERFPMYNPVSASRHGNAPLQEAKFVRDFSGAPWEGTDKEASGITYDPCTEKFVLIYDHIETPGSISDVWGAAIGANPPYDNYWNGPFAYGFTQQRGGDISFLTAEGYSASCGAMNKLVVTYTDLSENSVYAVEVTGNNDTSNPNYTNSQSSAEHFLVDELSASLIPLEQLVKPVISGSDYQGRMMIAYSVPELLFGSNIFGRLIDIRFSIYLPLILR